MSLIIDAIENHNPLSLALVDDRKKLSYGALKEKIERYCDFLFGVRVLGLALDNSIEWVLWDLAAVKMGVVCVPLPPFFTEEQRNHIIKSAGITHIISALGLVETGAGAVKNIPEGTAKITFTSGTTGTPKGVCLPQDAMEQVAQSLVDILDSEIAEKHLSVLPLAVLLENIAGVYATLLAGGTCHMYNLKTIGMENPFQPDFVLLSNIMAEYKINSAILVPELLRGLMQTLLTTRLPLPSLKFLAVGGSKVAPELVKGARNMGLPVYEGYGLSECASVVSLNMPGRDAPGTAGTPLPHIDLTARNGEFVIKNPAFLGYLGEEHAGSFSTGDLGHVDEGGFVHIEGRKKNILITAHGRNVSPEWVESALLSQPEILQVIVYGEAQPYLSALIVPARRGVDLNRAVDKANSALPEYAQIKDFRLVSPFTMQERTLTGTGRPRREVILSKYQSTTKMKVTI